MVLTFVKNRRSPKMINTQKKMEPFVEVHEADGNDGDQEKDKSSNDDDTDEDNEENGVTEEESSSQTTDGKSLPPRAMETNKPAAGLNLNNEVVLMRKDVKRVKALIIRKLARQIVALKKKKGKEAEIERNLRRAARLLEEVHSMKQLPPDVVTKTALQKSLSFDQVCKDPKSTVLDRAVARIAAHPQFRKKIESIKAAVKAFKDEHRTNTNTKVQKQHKPAPAVSPGQSEERNVPMASAILPAKCRGERKVEKKVTVKSAEEGENKSESIAAKPQLTLHTDSGDVPKAPGQRQEKLQPASVRPALVEPEGKAEHPASLPPVGLRDRAREEESDVDSSDTEEKEYFDDSTEERFLKQSSQSEESGDDDDFFIGKVSKFKKKKKKQPGSEENKEAEEGLDGVKASDKLQGELDELESRLKSKPAALQSVFCSSLAKRKGGVNRGGGRGGFRGQGKPYAGGHVSGGSGKQGKLQKLKKEGLNSLSQFNNPQPKDENSQSHRTAFAPRGRGRGRGRGNPGPGGFSQPVQQPGLHPSWEASKKRKEQQGQILAFQGKKIKFDDD